MDLKLTASKSEEVSKLKKKEESKKRPGSLSPVNEIKTKIFNKNKVPSRKISYQIGENYNPQKVNLNPIKVFMKEAIIK